MERVEQKDLIRGSLIKKLARLRRANLLSFRVANYSQHIGLSANFKIVAAVDFQEGQEFARQHGKRLPFRIHDVPTAF